jgi:hypothetical protein
MFLLSASFAAYCLISLSRERLTRKAMAMQIRLRRWGAAICGEPLICGRLYGDPVGAAAGAMAGKLITIFSAVGTGIAEHQEAQTTDTASNQQSQAFRKGAELNAK